MEIKILNKMIEQGLAVSSAWNIAHKQLDQYDRYLAVILSKLQNIDLDLVGIEVYDNLKSRQKFIEDKRWDLAEYCQSLAKQF